MCENCDVEHHRITKKPFSSLAVMPVLPWLKEVTSGVCLALRVITIFLMGEGDLCDGPTAGSHYFLGDVERGLLFRSVRLRNTAV